MKSSMGSFLVLPRMALLDNFLSKRLQGNTLWSLACFYAFYLVNNENARYFAAGDRSVTAFVRGDSRRLEKAQRPNADTFPTQMVKNA